jgi:cell division septation protein DedD
VKREASVAAIAGVLLLAQGCGPSEEAEEAPATSPKVEVGSQRREFETKTDTVNTVTGALHRRSQPSSDALQVRYMVQVGAFKDPQNASKIQALTRERYHLPVVNDYLGKLALYQIRVGFFESREAATAFLQRMQKEYPKDYKDSWVVQLRR